MLESVLQDNITFIKDIKSFRIYESEVKNLVNVLNTKKIAMISGIRNAGRVKLVHSFLRKTNSFENCFYFNTELDRLNSIKSDTDLITLFDIYVRLHGVPKIIILQDCESIDNIKNFILRLISTKKYKILLVGNNIKVDGIKEIESFPMPHTQKSIINHIYGGIPEVRIIEDISYKKFVLKNIKHDIVTKDILETYNIKNISLYLNVISYISLLSNCSSTREIHRQLELHGIEVSLLTLIDYLNASINTKLLKKCYLYDLKTQKEIQSRALYYFGDTGIRHSFCGKIPELIQNTLYIELEQRGYSLFVGKNGRFEFDFYAKNKAYGDVCLSIDTSNDKNEIRKTARKLAKIGDNSKKYIIVQNKNSLGMRKFFEEGVEILELWDFLQKLS